MSLHVYDDLEQGTEAWHDARRGLVTASVVGKLITEERPDALEVKCSECQSPVGMSCISKRKPHAPIGNVHDGRKAAASDRPTRLVVAGGDTARGLALTLAAERIAGFTEETPMTADMWRGRDMEPFARNEYGGHHHKADEIGFMVRTEDDWTLGYSPDGLVGDDGLIEIKAPRAKSHVATVIADEVPMPYMAQCQAGLLVSGRKWCDYIPYVGGLPLWVKRIYPDPDWQRVIVAACQSIEADIAEIVADYRSKTANLPATERIDLNLVELTL